MEQNCCCAGKHRKISKHALIVTAVFLVAMIIMAAISGMFAQEAVNNAVGLRTWASLWAFGASGIAYSGGVIIAAAIFWMTIVVAIVVIVAAICKKKYAAIGFALISFLAIWIAMYPFCLLWNLILVHISWWVHTQMAGFVITLALAAFLFISGILCMLVAAHKVCAFECTCKEEKEELVKDCDCQKKEPIEIIIVEDRTRRNEAPVVAPAPAPVKVAAPAPKKVALVLKKKYDRVPFVNKLKKADKSLLEKYNELKAYILSYGVNSRISISGDTFSLKGEKYAFITIAGKHIKFYLPLKYKDYANTPLPVSDESDVIKYVDVPLMLPVRSDLSLRRAKSLVDDVMGKKELPAGEIVTKNYAAAAIRGQKTKK